jgi:hypothetical protein
MQRRLTGDEQKKLRDAWEILSQIRHLWQEIDGVRLAIRLMFEHNTTDGRPYVEPPLADEDARQRPWVMARTLDECPWQGPFVLIRERKAGVRYVVENFKNGAIYGYNNARRATPEEIAAAGLEVTE